MAWLSGLAGKAEHLLNKIDQNTAAVLNKEKNGVDPLLTEVKWVSPEIRSNEHFSHPQMPSENAIPIPEVVSIPDVPKVNSSPQLGPQIRNTFVEIVPAPKVPSVTSFENHHLDSDSEMSMQSGRSSPSSIHHSGDMPINNKSTDASSEECNLDSAGEVANSPGVSSENRLLALRRELKNHLPSDEYYSVIRRSLEDKNDFLNRQQTDHQKEINALKEKLQTLGAEKRKLLRDIAELTASFDRSRLELVSARSELEQHKARALKTLQEKETLIAKLSSGSSNRFNESSIMEINQLKQENEILRKENQHMSEQLEAIGQELFLVNANMEKVQAETKEAKVQAQEVIDMERMRRLVAEEDAKNHSEEIGTLKAELSALRQTFSEKSLRQENEISRLRNQMSAMSTPSSEVESRLATLTQTLVSKQQALEALTTERNALRLQLERLEHEYRLLGNARRNGSYNSVNDTDDVKAQVPTFLVESPFDTGVTRRVKRAYSTLDAISIRTGVFLRRYPLARILVFTYMALLQLWVLVVLLSQSPEAH